VKVIPIREGGGKRRFLRELETIIKFSHPRVRMWLWRSGLPPFSGRSARRQWR
jgi:hypothetical protein